MRGVNHRDAFSRERGHALEDKAARFGVDADGDFIQKNQRRAVDQADSKIQTALEAAGKIFRQLGRVRAQIGLLNQVAQVLFVFHAIKRGEKTQIFPHAQQRIKSKILRHQRNALLLRTAQFGQRLIVKHNLPLLHRLQARQQRHQRGFARAVGAEQTERFTLRHRQAHIIQRGSGRSGIAVTEIFNAYHGS